ncbi:DUF7860 family protein [Halorarum salinum]|uniref:Uncharacterized protein n=1 Tax=Halorarum salinum TaxID=2743089 RepID=A0A7D5L8S1_9EURY|nr:hypothetical protein [Halobaculum salinum]QLG60688.1 hypothetical protein HUG12_02585 [Halobaculum salinum]
MGRYGDLDYARLTKGGVAVCAATFVLALLAQFGAAAAGIALPGWEAMLLTDLEYLSILGAVLSVFVFGVVLPLTE